MHTTKHQQQLSPSFETIHRFLKFASGSYTYHLPYRQQAVLIFITTHESVTGCKVCGYCHV